MKTVVLGCVLGLLVSMNAMALEAVVTEAPYHAAGNGKTNDRAAIQRAIDDVSAQGGGTVVFPERRTFLTGGLELKSNVTLKTGHLTVLLQSNVPADYTTNPGFGKPYSGPGGPQVPWDSNIAFNYPFIYAGPGTRNVKITGIGKIKGAAAAVDCETLFCFLVGMFRVSGFEISEVTIENAHGYNIGLHSCDHGLIKKVRIYGHDYDLNDDGISLQNCQDIRVTECHVETCDDVIVIWSSYRDPRGRSWWNSNEPQGNRNIEIDHNVLRDGGAPANYHGIIFFPWGGHCPDLRQVEISNIYVHDNDIRTPNPVSGYSPDAYSGTKIYPPAKDIRFERNTLKTSFGLGHTLVNLGFPVTNFWSDVPNGKSASNFLNGDFENIGTCYWSERKNTHPESTGARDDAQGQNDRWYGFIKHLETGDVCMFQGLWLEPGAYDFQARVQSSGVPARLFVQDNDGRPVAALEFTQTSWQNKTLPFAIKSAGNYRLGLERGQARSGWARIDSAVLILEKPAK